MAARKGEPKKSRPTLPDRSNHAAPGFPVRPHAYVQTTASGPPPAFVAPIPNSVRNGLGGEADFSYWRCYKAPRATPRRSHSSTG